MKLRRMLPVSGALPAIVLLALLSGCGTVPAPAPQCSEALTASAPILVECLPEQAGGGRLMVVNLGEDAAHWYLLEEGRARQLAPPPVSMLMVDSVAASRDGRFAAVISVGEGHPVLDVLDLARALDGEHGDRALATVNPYPGWIALDGWKDGAIQVRSDRPLPDCCDSSGAFRGETFLDPPQVFQLDPLTGSWVGR